MALERETVDEVARRVVGATNGLADNLVAADWIADRYRELASRGFFKHLRKVAELTLPASIDTGTITTTRGSTTVTGNSAAQAVWNTKVVGRYLRSGNVWYEIDSYENDTIFLKSEWAESAVSAGSYDIVQRFHELPDEARWVGTFVHKRLGRPLDEISLEELDDRVPWRVLVADSGPTVVVEASESVNGNKRIEVYPYVKSNDEIIGYVYWSIPQRLKSDDNIPRQIDSWILREGALIDAYRFLMAQALSQDSPQVEVAATWGNMAARQETKWKKDIQFAYRNDSAISDKDLVLSRFGRGRNSNRDISTGYDYVYTRGARP